MIGLLGKAATPIDTNSFGNTRGGASQITGSSSDRCQIRQGPGDIRVVRTQRALPYVQRPLVQAARTSGVVVGEYLCEIVEAACDVRVVSTERRRPDSDSPLKKTLGGGG